MTGYQTYHIYTDLYQSNTLAACANVHSCMTVQEVRGSTTGTDSQNSGFHPFEVGTWVATITGSGWLLFEKIADLWHRGILNGLCGTVALQEWSVTCNVSGDNG